MESQQKLAITTGSWIRGILVIVTAYLLYQVHEFILVLIASIVIASAIEPAASWAKRKGVPRLPMVLLIYIMSAFFLVGLFYFLVLPLIGEMSSFIKTLTIYSNSVTHGGILSEMFKTQNLFGGFDTPILVRELSVYLNSLSNFLSRGVFTSLSSIFGGVLNFFLILVLSFYLVVQEDGIGKFLKIITPLRHENYVIDLWKRSQIKIGLWMQGQLLSSLIILVLVYIGLLVANIPHALLLAVLAGVLELIPLFGATIAAIPAIFVAYVSGGFNMALIVAGIYILVQQFEGNLIYPLVVKRIVGLPPIISIMALVVGGTLAGFLGVLIAVPVAAVLMEFISDIEKRKSTDVSGGASL